MSGNWKFGICDCLKSPEICLWSWCVPGGYICMQVMAVNNALENDVNAGLAACLLASLLCWFGSAMNRTAIRKAYNIKGNYITDLVCWCFCPICANVQEYREAMDTKYNNSERGPWNMK